MTQKTMTIEEVETAPIGTKMKSANGTVEAIRVSAEKWNVNVGGKAMTMHHSRIVPYRHTKTLSGKSINHVSHVGYVLV